MYTTLTHTYILTKLGGTIVRKLDQVIHSYQIRRHNRAQTWSIKGRQCQRITGVVYQYRFKHAEWSDWHWGRMLSPLLAKVYYLHAFVPSQLHAKVARDSPWISTKHSSCVYTHAPTRETHRSILTSFFVAFFCSTTTYLPNVWIPEKLICTIKLQYDINNTPRVAVYVWGPTHAR